MPVQVGQPQSFDTCTQPEKRTLPLGSTRHFQDLALALLIRFTSREVHGKRSGVVRHGTLR